MLEPNQEHTSIRIYDSRFTIESAIHDGKPVFLVSEYTEKGAANQYVVDTYFEALTRFAQCIDTQAQFHLRNDPALTMEGNGILGVTACIDGSRNDDYKGKIVVLKPEVLRPEYRIASEQLIYAQVGFGCSPTANGRMVSGLNLYSGKEETHARQDFMGIADLQKLPNGRSPRSKSFPCPSISGSATPWRKRRPTAPHPDKQGGKPCRTYAH